MLDGRGFIAETNATHLFMVLPGATSGASGASGGTDLVLATPTTVACPEGITRATVLRLAASAGLACAEGDYTLTQLYNASEVFVTGTMGGLAPVVSVDGRQIGDGSAGPVTKQLTELYASLTATTGTTVVLARGWQPKDRSGWRLPGDRRGDLAVLEQEYLVGQLDEGGVVRRHQGGDALGADHGADQPHDLLACLGVKLAGR